MKRMIDIKKYPSRKVLATVSVVLMIASVGITTVWQIPTALATPLEEIKASREVSAPFGINVTDTALLKALHPGIWGFL